MEKGNLKINSKGTGIVKIGKKKHSIPTKYTPVNLDFKSKECDVEFTENKIEKILVNGKELPINKAKREEQEAKKRKKKKAAEEKKKEDEFKEKNKYRISKIKNDSLKLSEDKFHLPNDTQELLEGNEWMVDNFLLKFEKAPRFTGGKFSFFKKRYKKDPGYKIVPYFGDFPFGENANNTQQSAESLLGKENLSVKDYKTKWHFALGLGNESVYETSISLHHLYGIPFISASALKGTLRSWIISNYFTSQAPSEEKDYPLTNAEYRSLMDESFCKIFGCPSEIKKVKFEDGKPIMVKNKYKYWMAQKTALESSFKGEIVFFDAFPTSEPTIEPDILNNHYPDYYGKNKQPTDMQNPNPVLFLVVKDTPFKIIFGSRTKPISEYLIGNKNLATWMEEMLQNHGIGAKTAVGYGYMDAIK